MHHQTFFFFFWYGTNESGNKTFTPADSMLLSSLNKVCIKGDLAEQRATPPIKCPRDLYSLLSYLL